MKIVRQFVLSYATKLYTIGQLRVLPQHLLDPRMHRLRLVHDGLHLLHKATVAMETGSQVPHDLLAASSQRQASFDSRLLEERVLFAQGVL